MANLFGEKLKSFRRSNDLNDNKLDTKKNSFLKKIIIVMAICLLGIVITATTLSIIYHPRNLSSYIKEDISTFKRIEVQNYDGTIFTFNEKEQKELSSKVLEINVIPKHIFIQKVVSSYNIIIYFEEQTYEINQYYIYDGSSKFYFEPVNFSMYALVCEYVGEDI